MESSEFIDRLVDRIKNSDVFDLVLQEFEQSKKSWDQVAREKIGSIVKNVFQELFPGIEVRDAVNIEREGTLKTPYQLFGSYGQHPDIRIIKPMRIAIELDHSGEEWVTCRLCGVRLKTRNIPEHMSKVHPKNR